MEDRMEDGMEDEREEWKKEEWMRENERKKKTEGENARIEWEKGVGEENWRRKWKEVVETDMARCKVSGYCWFIVKGS